MASAGAQIFFASVRAVLEIFCVGAVGVLGARRGWLDRKTCKTLSTFNGNFFLPALLWVPEPLGERERAAKAVVTAGDVRRARDARTGARAGRRALGAGEAGLQNRRVDVERIRQLAGFAGGRGEGDHQEPEDWEFDVHER